MKLDKKTICKIIIWSVLGPIAVNILMYIPSFGLAATTTENWLGFFGNYSGGIVGGVVAYIITKSQIEHEKEERKAENREKENFAYTLVQTFLYDELKSNLRTIPVEAFKEQSEGILRTTYIIGQRTFNLEIYNEIKFELVKYNNPIVRETVEVYKKLKQLEQYYEINSIPKVEALKFYEDFNKWKIRLSI